MLDRPTSTCPTRETLEQFVAGELQDERVSGHLDDCRICSRTAEQIARDNKLVKEFVLTADDSPNEVGMATSVPEIEGFEILSEIHRGGQGIVYKAIQENTKRTVALKMLLPGPFASKRQRHRFEREIELIAKLRHPNIVTLYESGVSRDGRHFFAMEYIRGRPLDAYLREDSARSGARRPPNRPEPILRLFAKIAEAVQYAHQRGIIHRDLKPGNILVDSHDEPHVLDFGLAKVLGLDVLGSGLRATQTGEFMGTLAYAAPEQVRGAPDLVDTRTDVYALGVILYEMLTGELPYAVSGSLSDAIHSITEAAPVKLSTYRPRIGEEVETIVLKALSKEQTRRYQSADALGRDVVRYLAGDPIDAKSDSGWYVLKKTIRRHKLSVCLAVSFALVIVAYTIALSVSLARTAQARDDAQTEARKLKAINDFLNNDLLAAVDPSKTSNRDITMLEVLNAAAEKIGRRFEDQPLLAAELRATLGRTYRRLGDYAAAETHEVEALKLRRDELGEEHPDILSSMNDMGVLYTDQGRYEKAEELHARTLEIRRRVLGQADPDTLFSMNNLALVYRYQGRYAEAETLYVDTVEGRRRVLGEEHPHTLISMNNLASLYTHQDRYGEAEVLHAKVLEVQRRSLGDEHSDTLASMNNLAHMYFRSGRAEKARPLLTESLKIRRRALGDEHPATLTAMSNLASLHLDQARPEEAEALFERTLEIQRRVLGGEHPNTLSSMDGLGRAYREQGRTMEAKPLFEQTLDMRRRVLGAKHRDTLESMGELGAVYNDMGDYGEAEVLLEVAVESARRTLPEGQSLTAMLLKEYGVCLSALGRYHEAERALLESHSILREAKGAVAKQSVEVLKRIVDLYEAWKKPGKAGEYRAMLPESDEEEP